MYYNPITCIYYDHSICIYSDSSVCLMSYRPNVRCNSGQGVQGASPFGKKHGLGGPPDAQG